MRVLVVSSPHAFSTRDVYKGHLAGLQHVLGPENVVSYDILHRYQIFHTWTHWLEGAYGSVPPELRANILAAEPVLGAAHFHKVDAIYFISPMYFPMSIVDLIREDGYKCWAYFTECPYEDELWSRGQARHFDVCFVNDPHSLPRFRAYNENTHYLAHAYNPAVHYPGRGPAAGHEHVVLVGTGFKTRKAFLSEIDWSGIDIRLYGGMWEEGDETLALKGRVRNRLIDNQTTAKIYRGATIGLSMHRTERTYEAAEFIDPGEAYSVGPRTYELAACGLFQISDYRPELKTIFNGSMPVYDSPQEMGNLIRYYLAHPQERESLARQQLEAVKPHTVDQRMAQLLEIVN